MPDFDPIAAGVPRKHLKTMTRSVQLGVGAVYKLHKAAVLAGRDFDVDQVAEALEGGMPAWKYIANRCLTIFENVMLGQNLGDFHSGFRAYHRKVLEAVPWRENSNDFVFDTQFLAQAVFFGFRLGDIPVPVRYFKEASSINFRRSLRYGLLTVWIMILFWLNRLGLSGSAIFQRKVK